jgi:hypothetical protein
MCENIFKNSEEKKRREDFTRLFVKLVANQHTYRGNTGAKTGRDINAVSR